MQGMQYELKPVKDREDTGDKKADMLTEARERAQYGHEYWFDLYVESQGDVTFLGGDQWDPIAKASRIDEKRPMLTINTLPQHVDQVLGDILQNRPSIHISPSDSDGGATKFASKDGKTNYTLAQTYEGIIRNIEYVSGAESHYDTAAQHAIESGLGWLRVYTRYCYGATMDQELVIGSLRNRWSVIVDPDYLEYDMSDMGWAFVYRDMRRREYKKRWPEASEEMIGSEPTIHGERRFIWSSETKVKVAEYFRREAMKRELVQLTNGVVGWVDEIILVEKEVDGKKVKVNVMDELRQEGIEIHATRKVDTYKVLWSLISGKDVLEKEREWPGETIPLIPVAGKRLDLEDGSIYRGLIHHAKDAKRADNYYVSAAVERIGLAPKAPWVLYAEEIEGHEAMWNEAHTKNRPYLVINRASDNSRPQRTEGAQMPVAELQMAALMTDRVKSTIGQYDASLGARSNETSGRAILARQKETDTSTFQFSDNLSKAIRRIGIICCEVIPKIMDGTRVARLRARDGSTDFVELNKTVTDKETGATVLVNDIRTSKMDVVAKAGPSYNTQREEATEAMLEFVRVVPAAGQIILDKIAKNMDWPGSEDIAGRLIKMVPMNFLTEREIADNNIQPPTPSPAEEAEIKKAEGTIAASEATKAMAVAKTKEAEAKLAEIENMAAGGDEQVNMIRDLVAEALAEVLAAANQQTPAPAPEKPAGKAKGNGKAKPAATK